jgi:branched-chain amino acid transport system substrate-binding protein
MFNCGFYPDRNQEEIMKRHTLFAIFISFLLVAGFVGCGGESGEETPGVIKIGVLLPLSGSKANFGEMEKNSFQLALEEINAEGGINGRKIEFIYEDDMGKPDVGRTGMEKLILQDKVPLVTGGYSSSVTFSAAQVAQKYRVPFLVNTGSVDKITEPESFNLTVNDADKFYIYRLNPPVSEYAGSLSTFLSDVVKPASVFILHENTAFGSKATESFAKSCKEMGIEVKGSESYAEGTVDFKPLLMKVKESGAELVYMTSYVMDAAMLMKQSRELKLYPGLFVGNGAGYTMPAFKENAGVASEKVISSTLWHQTLPIPGAQEYYDKYTAKFGSGKPPDYHGAEAYAAAYVIKDTLTRAKKYDAQSLKKALAETDVMTAFGPVKFTSYGKKINQNRLSSYVVQWINGAMHLIWPVKLADTPYVYPINWAKEWRQEE